MLPVNSVSLGAAANSAAEAAPATSSKSKPMDAAEQQKLKKAAGDFESILLSSMWKSMKKSFGDSNEGDSDPASGTIDDLGVEAMSDAVGKVGGLGIGNMIIKQLEPHDGK